ncbi:MAG: RNA polymerase sigma factor [Anaerovoracaceae bacterium]
MMDYSAELVKRIQHGDTSSFEKLFNMYKDKAVRTAYLITKNSALAEDAVQEAFILCYFKIRGLKDPAMFKTWFFRILTRLAWRMSAKEKGAVSIDDVPEAADLKDSTEVEKEVENQEQSAFLMRAVKSLDIKQQTVIFLYYYNDFSVKEIARVMGSFEGTVKSRLHAARKNLRKYIEAEENYTMEGRFHEIIGKI